MLEAFTLIAHRGFSSRAPENTLAAFDLALSAGFDNFELDAQLTADGIPVVIHDATLDRTTDGRGHVAKTTLNEIRRLDAGSWFGGDDSFAGERVPTLHEVLTRYAGNAHIHLELKSAEPELPAKVALLLGETRWLRYADGPDTGAPGVTVISFDYEQLGRSMALLSHKVRHGWLVEKIDGSTLDAAGRRRVSGLYPRARLVTADSVRQALAGGYSVRAWGVETHADILRLIALGVRGATVDWPDVARSLVESVRATAENR